MAFVMTTIYLWILSLCVSLSFILKHQNIYQLLNEDCLQGINVMLCCVTQVMTGRELQLYVGCHCIKLLLNVDCSIMQIRCEDITLLHHVKQSLAQLLKQNSDLKQSVLINRTILSMAQVITLFCQFGLSSNSEKTKNIDFTLTNFKLMQ